MDRRFFVGVALGIIVAVSLLNVSALVLAQQRWLADHGGLVFHRKTSDNGMPRISISESLGRTLADWDLMAVDGSEIKLSSLGNRVLFVNLWATWCGPWVAGIAKHTEAACLCSS